MATTVTVLNKYFLPAGVWFKLYLMFLSPDPGFWFLFLLLFVPSLLDDGVRRLEILQDRRAGSHHGGDDDTHD